MKSIAKHILSILGVGALIFFAGVKYERWRIASMPRVVTHHIVERTFELPPKIEWRKAETVPLDSGTADMMLEGLDRDSLARAALSVKKTTFVDTVAYEDSLGSFTVRAVHEIEFDGVLNEFRKRTTYSKGQMETVNTDTIVYIQQSYLEMLLDIAMSPVSWIIAVAVYVSTLL